MLIQPYLFFEGRCDEAIAFYRQALGAQVKMLMRFRESPDPDMSQPGMADKVMHAELRIGASSVLVSDGRGEGLQPFQGFSLTILVSDAAEAEKYFTALSPGGKVQMPLTETFFAPRFGMITDRFGVLWMVIVTADKA